MVSLLRGMALDYFEPGLSAELEPECVSAPCTYFHIMLPLEHDILCILSAVV